MTNFLNYLHNSLKSPKLGSISITLRTLQQSGLQPLQLSWGQFGFAFSSTCYFETSFPMGLPGMVPTTGCLAAYLKSTGDLRLRLPLENISAACVLRDSRGAKSLCVVATIPFIIFKEQCHYILLFPLTSCQKLFPSSSVTLILIRFVIPVLCKQESISKETDSRLNCGNDNKWPLQE